MNTILSPGQYNYQSSESAPKNYPMEIISGSLIFNDGSGSLYIPNKVTISHGWGDWRSSHVSTDNYYPLPNKFILTFFSYTEDQFYKGSFDLPYEKISDLFKQGYFSIRENKIVTYNQFIIGVAPGGKVAVWLNSIDKRKEVFYGQADKIEGDWTWILDNPEISRKEFVLDEIMDSVDSPEILKNIKNNIIPYGLWDKYHEKRYNWKPLLTEMNFRDHVIDHVIYYNGEEDFQTIYVDERLKIENTSVPSEIHITWNRTGFLVNDLVIKVYFNESEIFNAFETIAKDQQPIEIEFRMEPEKNYDFTIWLRNAKNSIELKKTKIKTWKPGGMRYENAKSKDIN